MRTPAAQSAHPRRQFRLIKPVNGGPLVQSPAPSAGVDVVDVEIGDELMEAAFERLGELCATAQLRRAEQI